MIGEELARQIEPWRQELLNDVISHYKGKDAARGRLAFDRWKTRFAVFLQEHAPGEAFRFQVVTHHSAWVHRPGELPYDKFMREDGHTCIAFLDDLTDAAIKGRLVPATKTQDRIETPEDKTPNNHNIEVPQQPASRRNIILRIILSLILVGSFSIIPFTKQFQSWSWLQDHPNMLGLCLAASVIVLSIAWAILDANVKRRAYAISTVALGAFLVLAQIIGR